MADNEERMVSIWSWSAAILGLYGLILMVVGVYRVVAAKPAETVLAESHPDIWWPGLMLVVALGLYVAGRREARGPR